MYRCELGHTMPTIPPDGRCQGLVGEFGTGRPYRMCWSRIERPNTIKRSFDTIMEALREHYDRS